MAKIVLRTPYADIVKADHVPRNRGPHVPRNRGPYGYRLPFSAKIVYGFLTIRDAKEGAREEYYCRQYQSR